MKQKKNYIEKNEIDLTALLNKVWKKKILIITMSFLGLILDLSFLIKNNNIFNSSGELIEKFITKEVIIELPDQDFFRFNNEIYYKLKKLDIEFKEKLISNLQSHNSLVNFIEKLDIEFKEKLISNLQSHNSLVNFIEKSPNANNLKNFLEKEKVTLSQYLSDLNKKKIVINQKNQNTLIFFLVLPQEAKNDIFVEDYINLIYDNTIIELLKLLKPALLEKIRDLENLLLIQKEKNKKIINLLESQNELTIEEIKQGNLIILENYLVKFYFVHNEILNIKNILNNFESETNYFFKKKIQFKINEKKSNFPVKGLFLGLFGSLLVIFFKNIVKKGV